MHGLRRCKEQRLLLHALRSFLIVTLTILVVAIVLIMFVDILSSRVWTAWVVKGVIGLMSLCLGVGPFYMVRKVVGSLAAIGTLVLVLLASPALAGPAVRCPSTYSPTLHRYDTLCHDGTRAVSTWSSTLQQWTTTVTPLPGKTCTGRLNPKTRQWEGRCR